jgi:pimeloyl-ACP methyl ester carboxylesterase
LLGLKGWKVSLAQGLGVWDSKVRDLTLASYQCPECATREQQEHCAHRLRDRGHREAAKAMLRNFVRFDPRTFRPVWPCIDPLVADYKNINVPVLIAHGAWDETLSVAMGHKLRNEIPGACLVEIPRSSHALPTEKPATCADLIRRFVTQSGGLALPSGSELKVYPASPAGSLKGTQYSALGNGVDPASLSREGSGTLP